MPGDHYAFFGIVGTPLVRHGVDERLPGGRHTFIPVYTEMFLQVCLDYPSVDIRAIRAHEIRFLYEGIRSRLHEYSKPKR